MKNPSVKEPSGAEIRAAENASESETEQNVPVRPKGTRTRITRAIPVSVDIPPTSGPEADDHRRESPEQSDMERRIASAAAAGKRKSQSFTKSKSGAGSRSHGGSGSGSRSGSGSGSRSGSGSSSRSGSGSSSRSNSSSYSHSRSSSSSESRRGSSNGKQDDYSSSNRNSSQASAGAGTSFAARIAAAVASSPVNPGDKFEVPTYNVDEPRPVGGAGLPLTKNQRRELRRRELEALRISKQGKQ